MAEIEVQKTPDQEALEKIIEIKRMKEIYSIQIIKLLKSKRD